MWTRHFYKTMNCSIMSLSNVFVMTLFLLSAASIVLCHLSKDICHTETSYGLVMLQFCYAGRHLLLIWHFKVRIRKVIICKTVFRLLWGNLRSCSPDRLLQSWPHNAVNGNQTLLVHLPPLTPCNTLWRCGSCMCVCVRACVCVCVHKFTPICSSRGAVVRTVDLFSNILQSSACWFL